MARYYRSDSRVLVVPCLFESSRAGSRLASNSITPGVRDVADEEQEFYSRREPQPAESVPRRDLFASHPTNESATARDLPAQNFREEQEIESVPAALASVLLTSVIRRLPSDRLPPTPLAPAMFNTHAVHAFRSCTGALSSRTLARSSLNAVSRRTTAAMRSRHYSDQAAKDPQPAEESEKDEVEVSVETELANKLKAEEAKVADYTVSISLFAVHSISATSLSAFQSSHVPCKC